MNVVFTSATATDQLQRYVAIRRKNAENAYNRNVQYNGQNQKTVEDLEALLRGKNEPLKVQANRIVQQEQPEQQELQQLGAGQVKQIQLSIGKTLERGVRAEAISMPEPTTADVQLTAKASVKIMPTEAQIALHNMAKAISDLTTSVALPFSTVQDLSQIQIRFEKAVSSYSFQTKMKQNEFKMERPSYFKSA